jgi:hypothetical protein
MINQNSFNTTPNGTTIVNIDDVINLPTTLLIDQQHTPFIDNIIRLNPNINTFILSAGKYNIINVFQIFTNNIRLLGKTGDAKDVHIFQTQNFDGLDLNASNVVIQDISFHCLFSKKVCATIAMANNTVISGCHFYGAPDYFCIFYAGPSNLIEGESTLNGYTNYNLDTGNIFYNNVIYTSYTGDSVSFSLQYKSQFVGNYIRGGKVAIYMCRTTNVYNNVFSDSTTNGLYVSLPSDNLSIIGNKIYSSSHSGIRISNQMEHGPFTPYNYNILIKHNIIFGSKIYGIELNYLNGISIIDNKLLSGQTMGIYSFNGTNITIKNNKIAYFNYAVYFEKTNNSIIDSNTITSVFPNLGKNSIKIVNDIISINNAISNNIINGQLLYDVIVNGNINNPVTNNIINVYPSLDQEYLYNVT